MQKCRGKQGNQQVHDVERGTSPCYFNVGIVIAVREATAWRNCAVHMGGFANLGTPSLHVASFPFMLLLILLHVFSCSSSFCCIFRIVRDAPLHVAAFSQLCVMFLFLLLHFTIVRHVPLHVASFPFMILFIFAFPVSPHFARLFPRLFPRLSPRLFPNHFPTISRPFPLPVSFTVFPQLVLDYFLDYFPDDFPAQFARFVDVC